MSIEKKVCSVEGCERISYALSFCPMHYARHRKHGNVLVTKIDRHHGDKCDIEGCPRPYIAKGLCQHHYDNKQRHGNPLTTVYRMDHPDMCEVSGCNKVYFAKGYCEKHYNQMQDKGLIYISQYEKRSPIIEGDVVKVPIGLDAKDGYCLLDLEDIWIAEYKLYLSSSGYVNCSKRGKTIKVHRLVMGLEDPDIFVDHKFGNPLDNRKINLRIATPNQNSYNRRAGSNNKSGFKGVIKTRYGRWEANIRANNRRYYIGTFDTPEEAARAYDRKAIELHKEFALTNYPLSDYQPGGPYAI